MSTTGIANATLVNDGQIKQASIIIRNGLIDRIIYDNPNGIFSEKLDKIIDASGLLLFPGVIDDQVHFREPGLTHKGDIYSESKSGVAGGVTSFMEMPNTNPQTITIELLDEKFKIGAEKSMANYSFYLGGTNDNIEEISKLNPKMVCGVKVFMGSSTGNMLVDSIESLEKIFEHSPVLIATHCEDESTIKENIAKYRETYGEGIAFHYHADIRSEQACYLSSSLAVRLAKKFNSRLHVLHLSTGRELELFDKNTPLYNKRITAEVCVHHLWFSKDDYDKLGWRIKWNPSIKTENDRLSLIKGLKDNALDIVATDHAPHLLNEKDAGYFKSASGGPMVQHSLLAMIELSKKGHFPLELVAQKMCHAPAIVYGVEKRGFVKEGFFADLVLVNPNIQWQITKDNLLYKCGWSPLEGQQLSSKVTHTIINGRVVYENGTFDESFRGSALTFNR
ncbi:MAG TPA: dihydroorotase [Bacteroidales bacterium]|nr:dihydroorotase [Bacteroidales bacterium]